MSRIASLLRSLLAGGRSDDRTADGTTASAGRAEGSDRHEEPLRLLVGPDGGEMVWVPPGEFDMGSDEGNDDERPVHRVTITEGFWLGRCTVTNARYRRFCEATGRQFPEDSDQGDDHPVVCVSWGDAVAYCEFHGLALPTEAQWEYAARGPEGRQYPWGDHWDKRRCCNASRGGPRGQTFPVGSFPDGASWCGALDMAGNVNEWCRDWYVMDYYAASPATDPPGPSCGVDYPDIGMCRVIRGGSWTDRKLCRSACRNAGLPTESDINCGFRCMSTPGAGSHVPRVEV